MYLRGISLRYGSYTTTTIANLPVGQLTKKLKLKNHVNAEPRGPRAIIFNEKDCSQTAVIERGMDR